MAIYITFPILSVIFLMPKHRLFLFLISDHPLEKRLYKKAQAAAKEGMKMIERGTCLRFRERTTESDYLDFYYGEILK